MTTSVLLPFAAAVTGLLVAFASLLRKKPSPAGWFFFAGMATLALESLFTGLSVRGARAETLVSWLTLTFIVKSLTPVLWLGFSLTYSRGNYREFLARWRLPLMVAGLLPIALSLVFRDQLVRIVPAETAGETWRLHFGVPAKILNVTLLVALVFVLINLEQTFRAAVGSMRWRIKFVILALAVIFGAQVYVRSEAILFSAHDMALASIESGALLIGCLFFTLAYIRTGWPEIDIYPSRDVLRSSLTILIIGGYLFIVGVLAQLVKRLGGAEAFRFQSLIVLAGMAGLAVLLLSDRLRQRVRRFVARHFRKAQHDSVRIWTLLSHRLARVGDQSDLCAMAARSVSEIFDVLSVTVWLFTEENEGLVVAASTTRQPRDGGNGGPLEVSRAVMAGLRSRASLFDLDSVQESWAAELRALNPSTFPNGGNRRCVPLRSGETCLGVLILADRVGGAVYTDEELALLKCIGDQITSVLVNLRLTSEVLRARELEAFRTMSAFFVHDLKNAAASLNLTLRNLPVHFDDPAFREDALRGIGNTARRIDDMIARLSALRQRPDFTLVEADLNQLVNESLNTLNGTPYVGLTTELNPLPVIPVDREQIRNVVTNLVLNARDAIESGGRIRVRTDHQGGRVVLSVVDDGCGMSPAFMRDSLFRPFQSTKKHGLGIGMFQSRVIVERHGGSIQVESEVSKGTTVRVSFPVGGNR